MRVLVSYFDWQAADELDFLIGVSLHGNFHGQTHPGLYQIISGLNIRSDLKERCADIVFAKFNDGENVNHNIRSFSVGDLVMFEDGTALICKAIGWTEIKLPDNCKVDFDGFIETFFKEV